MSMVRLFVALLAALLSGVALADQAVPVYFDGKQANFKPQARVRAGTTYAPLRAVSEALGADVEWHEAAQMAVLCRGSACVSVKRSDGIIVDNQMLVPLRILSESLGAKVLWDSGRRAVMISSPR
jgi:hypothetical protein